MRRFTRLIPLVVLAAFAAADGPKFEVASIKPAEPNQRGTYIRPGPGGGLTITNMSLKQLITFAWRVQPFQVSGGPPWLDSIHYDILAKPESKASQSELPMMLQGLLADRFHLRVRQETRELPIYALVLARKDGRPGPDLMEAKDGDCEQPDPARLQAARQPGAPPPRFCGQLMMGVNQINAIGLPISSLTPLLSRLLGRTVVDQTGLKGNFNVSLEWTPDETQTFPPRSPGDSPVAPDSAAPSLFTAFQERLGLKFESQKGPVEIIVVDEAEKPSEN